MYILEWAKILACESFHFRPPERWWPIKIYNKLNTSSFILWWVYACCKNMWKWSSVIALWLLPHRRRAAVREAPYEHIVLCPIWANLQYHPTWNIFLFIVVGVVICYANAHLKFCYELHLSSICRKELKAPEMCVLLRPKHTKTMSFCVFIFSTTPIYNNNC